MRALPESQNLHTASRTHGQILNLRFFGMHFAEAARASGEVLRECEYLASVHVAKSRDNTVSGNINLVDSEQGSPVFHEHVKFTEGTGIKEIIYAITGGHLAAFELRRTPQPRISIRFTLTKFLSLSAPLPYQLSSMST
jgi:hypothetical protein